MKKIILSLLVMFSLSVTAFSQIEIYVEGDATNTDYSGGGEYSMYLPDDSDNDIKVKVYNESGSTQSWLISRRRLNTPASWGDYLCWGHETDQFGGICISEQSMDMDYYQMTSNAVTVADGEHGIIAVHVIGDFADPGTNTYRYYVGTSQNPTMDSIDVAASLSPLSVETVKPELTVGVQPNPASDNITIDAKGVSTANVQIVDVLGNVILNTTVSGSKSINVADYRNGIYFVNVSASGTRVSRKVIVRH